MFAVGAAWPDGGAPGVHLAWTGPDLVRVCLRGRGYDVERRVFEQEMVDVERQLVDNTAPNRSFDVLRRLSELGRPTTVFGPLALGTRPVFSERAMRDPRLAQERLAPRVYPRGKPATEPSPLFGSNELTEAEIETAVRAALGTGGFTALFQGPGVERLTQSFDRPADSVEITIRARCAFAAGLREGKVLAVAVLPDGPELDKRMLRLDGLALDTVALYVPMAPALDELLMVASRFNPNLGPWVTVATGLTLPIREADSTIGSPADEVAKVLSRLLPGEPAPDPTQLNLMLGALRAAFTPAWMGRAADRVLLVRQRPQDPPVEISLEAQLTALLMHPRWRRVMGFGFVDTPGAGAFQYRITGHFDPPEIRDVSYDVHGIPSGTEIPHTVHIGDVKLAFARPPRVVLAPPVPLTGELEVTRRGLEIVPGKLGGRWRWLDDLFGDGQSLVITFSRRVKRIELELGVGHSFEAQESVREWPPLPRPRLPLPPGTKLDPAATTERVSLTFASEIDGLRLFGRGVLYALILPGTGTGDLAALTPAIEFPGTTPPPAPPALLFVKNLQRPEQATDGLLTEDTALPARHDLGFELTWLPPVASPSGGPLSSGAWPDDLPGAPPLLASAYRIEHRELSGDGATTGPWTPLVPDDNLTFGSRETSARREPLVLGADLAELYKMAPHASAPRDETPGYTLHLLDNFERTKADGTAEQQLPALGTAHEYRIHSVDFIGRSRPPAIDSTWTLSRRVQLQKRFPPPQPVGPVRAAAPAPGEIAPAGVQARVIVDGPGLAPEDQALLIDAAGKQRKNAVVLQCAWRNVVRADDGTRANGGERERDPFATELRVYSMSRPPTAVSGEVTAIITEQPDRFELGFQQAAGEAWLQRNECVGEWLPSSGYEFQILEHGEVTADGQIITLVVARSAANPAFKPEPERVVFGRRLTRHHLRAYFWDRREAVAPLHADPDDEGYEFTLHDLFELDAQRPKQTIWVGVTAADSEPYIPDEVTRARDPSLLHRPGNESVVAAASITATYTLRPVLDVPPPLRDLPEVAAVEPASDQTTAVVPLSDWLGAAVAVGERVQVERCDTDQLAALLSVEGTGAARQLKFLHDKALHTIALDALNQDDRNAILDALSTGRSSQLASKYYLWLTYRHPAPDTLFSPLPHARGIPHGSLVDHLPAKPGRHLYRVRRVDAAGRASAGAAYAPGVVRVPRLIPPPSPERDALKAERAASGGFSTALTVSFPGDDDIAHILLFQRTYPYDPALSLEDRKPLPAGPAELLRVPNRRELYERGKAIRLRSQDNVLIEPASVEPIAGNPDVKVDAETRRITVTLRAAHDRKDAGAFVQSYCCTLSRDGIPSAPAGPFGVALPLQEGA
jgi:hypothetical protein